MTSLTEPNTALSLNQVQSIRSKNHPSTSLATCRLSTTLPVSKEVTAAAEGVILIPGLLGELDALKLILRAFVAAVIYTVRSALETLTPVAPTALNISSCTCDHRRFIRQDSLRIIRMHDFEMMYDV